MSRNYIVVATGLLSCALLLGGCAMVPGGGAAPTPPPTESSAPAIPPSDLKGAPEATQTPDPSAAGPPAEEPESAPEPDPTQDVPAAQAESCDWDSARMSSDAAGVPSGPDQPLEAALIGAWQHTHIDSGAGFEPLEPTTDIRYVFPSPIRILYCQDVKGATTQAENAADITIDGTQIVLPGGAPGYEAVAWSSDTMVWTNNLDGSTYLLKRR